MVNDKVFVEKKMNKKCKVDESLPMQKPRLQSCNILMTSSMQWFNHLLRSIQYHGVPDFEFGRKKLSPQVTTDSDTVFREESIGEGFKIVTVAVFEKILLFEKKIGSSLIAIFKPTRAVTKFLVK